MTVLVAVPESPEGRRALAAAAAEARILQTDLIVYNLGIRRLEVSDLPTNVELRVVERSGHHEPADLVLDYLEENPGISRLVIGMKRRTPVGKAVFGSISQRLLLEARVPVLAVKIDTD